MSSGLDAAARLAVAQAVYKMAADAVNTKSSCNLRAQLDDETVALWQMYGLKQRDLKIGGTKVGSMSVVTESRAQVTEPHVWEEWKLSTGRAELIETVDWDALTPHERSLVIAMVKGVNERAVRVQLVDVGKWDENVSNGGNGAAVDEDGCVVPGVRWVERVKNTMVRGCEPVKVAAALHALPEPVNMMGLLLGSGDE